MFFVFGYIQTKCCQQNDKEELVFCKKKGLLVEGTTCYIFELFVVDLLSE